MRNIKDVRIKTKGEIIVQVENRNVKVAERLATSLNKAEDIDMYVMPYEYRGVKASEKDGVSIYKTNFVSRKALGNGSLDRIVMDSIKREKEFIDKPVRFKMSINIDRLEESKMCRYEWSAHIAIDKGVSFVSDYHKIEDKEIALFTPNDVRVFDLYFSNYRDHFHDPIVKEYIKLKYGNIFNSNVFRIPHNFKYEGIKCDQFDILWVYPGYDGDFRSGIAKELLKDITDGFDSFEEFRSVVRHVVYLPCIEKFDIEYVLDTYRREVLIPDIKIENLRRRTHEVLLTLMIYLGLKGYDKFAWLPILEFSNKDDFGCFVEATKIFAYHR